MALERTARPRRIAVLGIASVLAIAAALASACGSEEDIPGAGADSGQDGANDASAQDDSSSISDAGIDARCLDVQPDADIDCTGKCGPVKDPCTGNVKQCGGCANGVSADGGDAGVRVCDLATNSCGVPKITCADLGAECSSFPLSKAAVKNSCGEYLDCPDGNPKGCASGKECDPDTHKCRDCQPVTCKDLGVECGTAWLGCGEDIPANYTDCGGCAPAADGGARKCNAVFHTCEPSCVPKTAAVLCADAKAAKGVECGVISNGCGGTVNCDAVATFGCKTGESCGVRGLANRCDPKPTPDECVAQGKNCGEITSACTGLKVKCGECATGQVCNANGVCGTPCTPKTCAEFSQFECGTFDDSCGSTVKCGNCAGGVCDNTTHTCCATNTCGATYAGKCGQDLANGCGQNVLDCNCTNPALCTTDGGTAPAPAVNNTGMCCTPRTAAAYAGQCGTNLANGCGQNNVNVTCPNGGVCVNNATGSAGSAPPNGTPGTCCTRTDTCAQAAGACAPVQNSCRPAGTTVACTGNCSPTQICNANTCCTPAAACPGGGGENAECNTVKLANGCGQDNPCNCGGGRTCWCTDHQCTAADGAGVCKAALACNTAPYAGQCGTALPNGIGGTIATCPCPTGRVCSTSTPGQIGTCNCANGLGAAYTCANVPNGPDAGAAGDKCGPFDNGCGGTLTCPCPAGQACNTGATPNVCCAPATCPASPGIGTTCGAVNNGCTTVNCPCPSGSGNENFTCTAGKCACVPDTCRGRTGSYPNRCGGTLVCGG